jgi:hypothetical protein
MLNAKKCSNLAERERFELRTGYPVRQISNATPVRERRHLGKTLQDNIRHGKMAR